MRIHCDYEYFVNCVPYTYVAWPGHLSGPVESELGIVPRFVCRKQQDGIIHKRLIFKEKGTLLNYLTLGVSAAKLQILVSSDE